MEPALIVNGFGGFLWQIPITDHAGITPEKNLTVVRNLDLYAVKNFANSISTIAVRMINADSE